MVSLVFGCIPKLNRYGYHKRIQYSLRDGFLSEGSIYIDNQSYAYARAWITVSVSKRSQD